MPEGRRVYAIGDVHGRLDLLDRLLALIAEDSAARGRARVDLIQLGDLIDRGPDSAGAVRRMMLPIAPFDGVAVLKGNHESMMLDALDGDGRVLRHWIANGGDAALASWGLDVHGFDPDDPELLEAARRAVPMSVRSWLARRLPHARIGDYYFVHAGVRPGVPFAEQVEADQLWIRQPFLRSTADHGLMVVHGHTPCHEVEDRPNRIGIDTGAYTSGRLTAIGLEGTERWFLETDPDA